MVTETPWMWIIGGPNGAGKTTLARAVLGGIVPTNAFVNTDEIAKTLSSKSWGSDMMAGRFSVEAVESYYCRPNQLCRRDNPFIATLFAHD